jgi:hypothetical protein
MYHALYTGCHYVDDDVCHSCSTEELMKVMGLKNCPKLPTEAILACHMDTPRANPSSNQTSNKPADADNQLVDMKALIAKGAAATPEELTRLNAGLDRLDFGSASPGAKDKVIPTSELDDEVIA